MCIVMIGTIHFFAGPLMDSSIVLVVEERTTQIWKLVGEQEQEEEEKDREEEEEEETEEYKEEKQNGKEYEEEEDEAVKSK